MNRSDEPKGVFQVLVMPTKFPREVELLLLPVDSVTHDRLGTDQFRGQPKPWATIRARWEADLDFERIERIEHYLKDGHTVPLGFIQTNDPVNFLSLTHKKR